MVLPAGDGELDRPPAALEHQFADARIGPRVRRAVPVRGNQQLVEIVVGGVVRERALVVDEVAVDVDVALVDAA